MSDHEGVESVDELIRAIGTARWTFSSVRIVRTELGVSRLTRTSFSAVGAAPTKETLARAPTATAKKREMNIVEGKSGGCYEA